MSAATQGKKRKHPEETPLSREPSLQTATPVPTQQKKVKQAAESSSSASLSSVSRNRDKSAKVKAAKKKPTNKYVPVPSPGHGHNIAFSDDEDSNSVATASAFFQWLIAPLSEASFYQHYFEKKPFALLRSESRQQQQTGEKKHKGNKPTLQDTRKQPTQSARVKLVSTRVSLPGLLKEAASEIASSTTQQGNKGQQVEEVIEVETLTPEQPSSSTSSQWSPSSTQPAHYYSGWFGKCDINSILSSQSVHYSKDLDITQYKNGERLTLNPPGDRAASSSEVWSFFSRGCSLRFLAPQQYSSNLWRMLNILDEALGMQTGANTYLTPKGTQGFSPHYDDVDIFILQTEGSKRWRLYAPRSVDEILPLQSSPNFSPDDLGECILDVWLQAGDFLYAPRGTIHQCVASNNVDSLHITVSSCLSSSWAHYLSILLPRTVAALQRTDPAFRRVLPLHYHEYMGLQHNEQDDDRREAFLDQVLMLFERMLTKADEEHRYLYDEAADEMALDFLHSRVAPWNSQHKKQRMIHGQQQQQQEDAGQEHKHTEKKEKDNSKERKEEEEQEEDSHPRLPSYLHPTTLIRLTAAGIARITGSVHQSTTDTQTEEQDSGAIYLHHCVDNTRLCRATPLANIEIAGELAPAVEMIVTAYPTWLQIQQLPPPSSGADNAEEEEEVDSQGNAESRAGDLQELLHLCGVLFESGLLEMTNDQSKVTVLADDAKQAMETSAEHADDEDDGEAPDLVDVDD